MRTNIDIDDELLERAKNASGLKTKKAVVEEALKQFLKLKEQVATFHALKGSADWQGDLRAQREDRESAKW